MNRLPTLTGPASEQSTWVACGGNPAAASAVRMVNVVRVGDVGCHDLGLAAHLANPRVEVVDIGLGELLGARTTVTIGIHSGRLVVVEEVVQDLGVRQAVQHSRGGPAPRSPAPALSARSPAGPGRRRSAHRGASTPGLSWSASAPRSHRPAPPASQRSSARSRDRALIDCHVMATTPQPAWRRALPGGRADRPQAGRGRNASWPRGGSRRIPRQPTTWWPPALSPHRRQRPSSRPPSRSWPSGRTCRRTPGRRAPSART